MLIAKHSILWKSEFYILFVFDIMFMLNMIVDLFIGFINKEG